jgi:hypothetical protein
MTQLTEEMEAQRKAVQRVLVLISRNRPSVEDTNAARSELNAVLAWFNAMHEARPTTDVSTDVLVDELVAAAWQEGGPDAVERLEKAKANVRAAITAIGSQSIEGERTGG